MYIIIIILLMLFCTFYFTTGEQTTVAVDATNRWTGQLQYLYHNMVCRILDYPLYVYMVVV